MSNGAREDLGLESFFGEIGERMELVAGYEAQVARYEAPRFNFFNGTYIDPDENRITDILADLLDPRGSHGQGSVLLCRSWA